MRTKVVVSLNGKPIGEAVTTDLGLQGLGIVSPVNIRAGVVLDLRFNVPRRPEGVSPVEARAKVIHAIFSGAEAGFRVGLGFEQLPEAAREAIENYLQ